MFVGGAIDAADLAGLVRPVDLHEGLPQSRAKADSVRNAAWMKLSPGPRSMSMVKLGP